MTRAELEHLIRAAGAITEDDTLVIVGSQAILGQFPDAPASLRVSNEADMYPLHRPERSDLIDGSIGELSPFHQAFGYYAQGVGEETATLPAGWKERLVSIANPNTRGITGLCLEVHDLVVSKCLAGRPRDYDFLDECAAHGLVDRQTLLERLSMVARIDEAVRERARNRIEIAFRKP